MKRLALIPLFFLFACGATQTPESSNKAEYPEVQDTPLEPTTASTTVTSFEDFREVMDPFVGHYFPIELANDFPLYQEPCSFVFNGVDIYLDPDNPEGAGYYLQTENGHRAEHYFVTSAKATSEGTEVKLIDSNRIGEGEAEETWLLSKVDQWITIQRMNDQWEQYYASYSEFDHIMADGCTDIETILQAMPATWINLTEVPDSDQMIIEECDCSPGSKYFDWNNGSPFMSWSGGCDSDSDNITSITKEHNIITIQYDHFGTPHTLVIDWDWSITQVAQFTITPEGFEPTTSYFVPEAYQENFDIVACENEH